jgi:hypothetical protein
MSLCHPSQPVAVTALFDKEILLALFIEPLPFTLPPPLIKYSTGSLKIKNKFVIKIETRRVRRLV